MSRTVRVVSLLAVAALLCPLAATAQPYLSELVGFNGPPINDPATSKEMFQIPQFSPTTEIYVIENDPNTPFGNNAAYRASGLHTEGTAALQAYFKWVLPVTQDSWVRLTTASGAERPNPALHTGGKVRFKVSNKSELTKGKIGVVLGIRETGVEVPQMENGGTTGPIEWVGVSATNNAIIAGEDKTVDTTAAGDDVQVYPVGFNLESDPNNPLPLGTAVITPGPNGVMNTTPAGDDELRHGYFIAADGARRPIPAFIINPSPTAVWLQYDLTTGVVSKYVSGSWVAQGGSITGFTGNGVFDVTPPRGTLEHIGITHDPNDINNIRIDVAFDELQFEAPDPDPVLPPSIVAPIIADDPTVTVTGLISAVDQVSLFLNDDPNAIVTQSVSDPNDVALTLPAPAVAWHVYRAKQRSGDSGVTSEFSAPVTVYPEPSPYSFSIVIDEDGNDCTYTPGGWEFVPVTSVGSGPSPQGTPLFNLDGVWQTIDVPLTDNDLVSPWLGGDGALAPLGEIYSIDSVWFTIAAGATSGGPHEAFVDAVELVDEFGQVIATYEDMETTNYLKDARSQSSTIPTSSALSTLASYDGVKSHRIVWTYPSTGATETLGLYHNLSIAACNTSPKFDALATATLRYHLLCRGPRTAPTINLPNVVGPIIHGTQSTVRVDSIDATATAVQLFIDGFAEGSPVNPNGATYVDFAGLTLTAGDSISATQTVPAGTSDLAYPRGVSALPLPPTLQTPIFPGATSVTLNNCLTATHATASTVYVYQYDDPNDTTPTQVGTATAGTATVVVTVPALSPLKLLTATQVVNGAESFESAPVTVAVPPPTIYAAPAQGAATVRVQDLSTSATLVTVTLNGTTPFTAAPVPGNTWVDVPVSGLVMGNTLTARQTAAGVDSAESASETVTTNATTTIKCDTMETYVDQADFENAPGEVRATGWWPSSGDPGLTLDFTMNATPGGTKSAYCPAGQSPPYGGQGDGWQSNFDFNYPDPDWPSVSGSATNPLVWSVTICDTGAYGLSSAEATASMYAYRTGGGTANVWVGATSFYFVGDTTKYQARMYYGGPNWFNLDHPGAPSRSIGWHVFTVVMKGAAADFYIDGVLAKKNVARNAAGAYDNFYMGTGLASSTASYYDDYCVVNGPFQLRSRLPNPATVGSPVLDGDTTVSLKNIEAGTTLVTVYANGGSIGSINPAGASTIDVPVTALVYGNLITTKATNAVGVSIASAALEVGQGNGDLRVCIGIRETGDAGALGTEGGTAGPIEWVGATGTASGAPQGQPLLLLNTWQTITFNLTDPNSIVAFPGTSANGVIDGTRGTLEHLAVAVKADAANRSSGVYEMYVDNVINVGAGAGGSNFVITDFEGFALGTEVLFQEPTNSGTTVGNLAYPPSASEVTNAEANGGTQSQKLTWFFKDTTEQRWARVTTSGTANKSRPIIDLTKPISMDILLAPAGPAVCHGDLNCDGEIGFGDINPFVLYLSNFAAWQTAYAGCPAENGDINGDGSYPSFGDINPFVSMLSTQPPPTCP